MLRGAFECLAKIACFALLREQRSGSRRLCDWQKQTSSSRIKFSERFRKLRLANVPGEDPVRVRGERGQDFPPTMRKTTPRLGTLEIPTPLKIRRRTNECTRRSNVEIQTTFFPPSLSPLFCLTLAGRTTSGAGKTARSTRDEQRACKFHVRFLKANLQSTQTLFTRFLSFFLEHPCSRAFNRRHKSFLLVCYKCAVNRRGIGRRK